MKKIFYTAMSLLMLATLLPSCKNADTQGEPWMEMTSGTGSFIIENGVSQVRMTINANCKWNLQLEFDDPDNIWASTYPSRGEDDGRFYFYLDPLTIPYARTCRIVAYDPFGKEIFSVDLTQTGTPAHITVDNAVALSSSSDGGNYTIPVNANVNWVASVLPLNAGDNVSWISLDNATVTEQFITIAPNTGDAKRFAIVRFTQLEDPDLYTDLEVVQLPVYSINNAELITITKLISDYSGIIDDNLKVEGFVTSNKLTENIPANELYIQDASGMGLLISFVNAADNIYTLNQKLTVWATGGTLRSESRSGGASYKVLTSLSSSNFSTTTSLVGTVATPVELTNFTQIDNYPNTLVKLKNATFVIPIGTLFNGNASSTDCCNFYLSSLRDGAGNTVVMRTFKSFTEKWDGNITASCYDVTALVLPDDGEMMPRNNWTTPMPYERLRHEAYKYTLRVRNYSDLSVTATANPYTPIALWYSTTSVSAGAASWAPQVGSGTFGFTDVGIALTMTSRTAYTLVDSSLGYSTSNTYYGYGMYPGWNASIGGASWKFSVSTAGRTGNIYVAFMAGSFGTAARYWKVQWSANGTTWNDVSNSEYEMWNNSTVGAAYLDQAHLYVPQEFFYKLPAGAAGQATLHIRLLITENVRVSLANSTTTIADTSPSCLYYVGVYEN